MRIPKRLISGSTLTGSTATYYTAPSNSNATVAPKTIIRKLSLCNPSAGAVACTVYLVPSGGTAGDTNTIISARSIAAGETWDCPGPESHVLEAGGTIQAKGNGVTIMCSGEEVISE